MATSTFSDKNRHNLFGKVGPTLNRHSGILAENSLQSPNGFEFDPFKLEQAVRFPQSIVLRLQQFDYFRIRLRHQQLHRLLSSCHHPTTLVKIFARVSLPRTINRLLDQASLSPNRGILCLGRLQPSTENGKARPPKNPISDYVSHDNYSIDTRV